MQSRLPGGCLASAGADHVLQPAQRCAAEGCEMDNHIKEVVNAHLSGHVGGFARTMVEAEVEADARKEAAAPTPGCTLASAGEDRVVPPALRCEAEGCCA